MTLTNRRMLTDRRHWYTSAPLIKIIANVSGRIAMRQATLIERQTKQAVAWTSCLLGVDEAGTRGRSRLLRLW